MSNTITPTVFYRTLNVEGLEIFSEMTPEASRVALLVAGCAGCVVGLDVGPARGRRGSLTYKAKETNIIGENI